MEASTSEAQLGQPQSYIYLSEGLEGQDERFDYLSSLFEQLQLATVETCNPKLDLVTFAQAAEYFAVIMKSKYQKRERELKLTEKRKSLTSSNRGSDGKMGSPKEGSLEDMFGVQYDAGYPNAQATVMTNQGPIGMSSGFSDPFVEEVDTARPTSQNDFWSDFENEQPTPTVDTLHYGFPPYGRSASDYGIKECFAGISMSQDVAIGLVYLVNLAGSTGDCLHDRELNVGIILDPVHRGKGYAHQAINRVLRVAFDIKKCHRVQVVLADHVAKDRGICFFTQLKFDHEGTRRRAFYSQMECCYKDITYMGVLDTDWMLRQSGSKCAEKFGRPAPKSVWDELLSRQQREREELLDWEAGTRSSGRLRPRARTPTQSCFRTFEANDNDGDDEMDIDNTLDTATMRKPKDGEIASKILARGRENNPFETSTNSDAISGYSASPDPHFSAASSSGSAWDVVEPSDFDDLSSSSSDCEDEASFEIVS